MTLFSGKGIVSPYSVSYKFSGHVPQFRQRVYRQFWVGSDNGKLMDQAAKAVARAKIKTDKRDSEALVRPEVPDPSKTNYQETPRVLHPLLVSGVG